MKSGASTVQDNMDELRRSLKDLVGKRVLVGVPASTAERDDDSPITNAELAYLHNYGGTIQVPEHETSIFRKIDDEGNFLNGGKFVSPSASNYETKHTVPAHTVDIPPRPFMEDGIQERQKEIVAALGDAAAAALNNNPAGVENNLHKAGLIGQSAIRNKMITGPFIPLSPATIAARRRRGHFDTKPLLESTALQKSITYVIRDKNGST